MSYQVRTGASQTTDPCPQTPPGCSSTSADVVKQLWRAGGCQHARSGIRARVLCDRYDPTFHAMALGFRPRDPRGNFRVTAGQREPGTWMFSRIVSIIGEHSFKLPSAWVLAKQCGTSRHHVSPFRSTASRGACVGPNPIDLHDDVVVSGDDLCSALVFAGR